MDQLQFQKKIIREEYMQTQQSDEKNTKKGDKRLPMKKHLTKFIQK